MIYSGLAYRAHDPKWAVSPLSGDGAAIHGGRFNPKGTPALYLATTLEGAVLEASRGFAFRFEPLTICTYELTNIKLADLTDAQFLRDNSIAPDDLASAWFDAPAHPPSWTIHDRLHRDWDGIRVPSFARKARADMHNIVLWHWEATADRSITVYDPAQKLPKDQRSWK